MYCGREFFGGETLEQPAPSHLLIRPLIEGLKEGREPRTMRITVPQLEGEIIELLEDMKHGATLWFSSKLSGQYHLELPDGQSVKIIRRAARTAWERGWINADRHKGGLTHYVLTAEGRIHCWRDATETQLIR